MRRLMIVAAVALSASPAFALQTVVKKGTKVGTGCVGRVIAMAPKLRACTLAATKTRIWCPNGDIFDDEGAPNVPLARSLCNLTQVP